MVTRITLISFSSTKNIMLRLEIMMIMWISFSITGFKKRMWRQCFGWNLCLSGGNGLFWISGHSVIYGECADMRPRRRKNYQRLWKTWKAGGKMYSKPVIMENLNARHTTFSIEFHFTNNITLLMGDAGKGKTLIFGIQKICWRQGIIFLNYIRKRQGMWLFIL